MEIRNYFRVIKKFIWWLIMPLFIVLVLTLILSLIFKESYEAPIVFAINRKPQQKETTDYQYDSYYAIQANGMLATQFAKWLEGGSVIPAIYQRAGLKENDALIIKEWKVSNNSPQNIELLFRGRNKERITELAKSAITTVDEKKEEFTGNGESMLGTVMIPNEVVVLTKTASLFLNLIVGFFAGLIIGLIFVYFKAIFNSDEILNSKS